MPPVADMLALGQYLERLALFLNQRGYRCRAVLPDVDGRLLAVTGTGRAVKAGTPEGAAFSRLLDEFVRNNPHPLMSQSGREMQNIVVDRDSELQRVWQQHLQQGKTSWGLFRLERLECTPGAIYFTFAEQLPSAAPGRGNKDRKTKSRPGSPESAVLVLRLTDGEDPRLERAERVLRVNRLAITVVKDTREPHPPPLRQPERYLAFVLARTTGPQTRIVARRKSVPDISLYGREVEANPLSAQSRQGASGMLAALAGFPRRRLKVIALGDQSCRQSFPPLERLTVNGGWSYFPVRTAFWPEVFVRLDFSEGELIGGSEGRLAEAIRRIKSRVENPLVAIVQTCLSRLIGDDILGVCRRELDEGQYLILDPDFQSKQGAVDSLLWPWLFRAYGGKPRLSKPRATLVNLVGFGHRKEDKAGEIERLLSLLNIEVNSMVFPSFTEEALERFRFARTTVASDCSVIKNAFGGVEDSRSWLFLPPPFGIERTSRWLEQVCRTVLPARKRRPALARIRAAADEARRKLDRASASLRGESLAIAASSSLSAFIFDHREIFGIAIVDMALELGLSVEIFIHTDAPLPLELHAVAKTKNVSLSTFDRPGPMLQALSESRAAFLLTSIARNAGALARGKYPLFPSDFEMGYAGAISTAEKLACREKSGFTERYRRWFAP